MKIISIRIKNLASLEGTTEIDFTTEPLRSAGIFAITGPTGSGKSTILDALCLALYGNTPRYNQSTEQGVNIRDVNDGTISQNDVRGILRDGTGEGFAEVAFIGTDGLHYKATWSVRRAKGRPDGNLQATTMQLKNETTGKDISGRKTEIKDEIERLIGLSFEQFTRSVLLAQGDFTAFLKANNEKKSSLLEKLTGTQIYTEISKRIFEKSKEANQDLDLLHQRKSDIQTLTDEEINHYNIEILEIDKVINSLEPKKVHLNKDIAWHIQAEKLNKSLNEALEAMQEAERVSENAVERKNTLKHIELCQEAKPWVDSKKVIENDLISRKKALNTTSQEEKTFKSLIADAQKELKEADLSVETITNDFKEAKPKLKEARELDVKIGEKTNILVNAKKEFDDSKKDFDAINVLLLGEQKSAESLEKEIGKIESWLENNSERQPIAENEKLILSKLKDALKYLKKSQDFDESLKQSEQNLKKIEIVIASLKEGKAIKEKEVLAAQEPYDQKVKEIEDIDINAIEKSKSEIDTYLINLNIAKDFWYKIVRTNNDLEDQTTKVVKHKKELADYEEQLSTVTNQIITTRSKKEESAKMLNEAKIAATENVEALRAQLLDDEPCPVCGSKHHPYVEHNPQLDKVISRLEKMDQENDKALQNFIGDKSKYTTQISVLQKVLEDLDNIIKKNTSELTSLNREWNDLPLSKEITHIADKEKSNWLSTQSDEKKKTQNSLNTQIQYFRKTKDELEDLKANLEVLKKELGKTEVELKDHIQESKHLRNTIASEQKDQKSNGEELESLSQSLSEYFNSPDWFQKWKTNDEQFVEKIGEFGESWRKNNALLVTHKRQLEKTLGEINNLKEKYQKEGQNMEARKEGLSKLNTELKELGDKRKEIFNGDSSDLIEEGLNKALEKAISLRETIKESLAKLNIELAGVKTRKEEFEKAIHKAEVEKMKVMKNIDMWLNKFNNSHELEMNLPLLDELLSFSAQWQNTERNDLKAIDNALTMITTVYKERLKSINDHDKERLSDRSPEELQQLLLALNERLKIVVNERSQIEYKLRADRENKDKIGGLLAEIKKQSEVADNWAKLNDIIGSADGKKFRQIAQEYTLDVLVSYANVHLRFLSSRYVLQRIPQSLGLQVLDTDMGNEVRTVYSLSGGESFLVSLALALGLASLSSSRMKVESLFIDEGFGSLDPETLNIAMDALERLHNQGRKVGVISHVQEMTERIPVQICVSKKNNGKSFVEIL